MKRTFISFLLFVLYCGLIYGRIIDADATVFFKEIFNFLEVEGMKPYVVNEQHMRFMYDDKQYNLVVYDGKPSLVRLYTDYSNILPLSDSTSIVIRKPDGVKVEFLDKTYRLTVDTHSLDVEPFKYEIYRQINMMGKAKVYFSYPDKGHKSQPELTYDKLKFTRKKINDSSEIFEVSCADGNKVSFNMVYVLGGSFEMGNLEGEHKSETVADFYISSKNCKTTHCLCSCVGLVACVGTRRTRRCVRAEGQTDIKISSSSLLSQTGVLSRTEHQPVCKSGSSHHKYNDHTECGICSRRRQAALASPSKSR